MSNNVLVKTNSTIITPWPDSFFGNSVLTNNNFIITSSSAPNFGTTAPNVGLDTLHFVYSGLSNTQSVSTVIQQRKLVESMPLNLNYDNLSSYVYFGKSSDFIIQEINDIILKFPASLFISNLDKQNVTTAEVVYYDPLNDYTHF